MNIYHECGYSLLMESVRQDTKFLAEFFDAMVKDHAEKVMACPCCGEQLGKKCGQEDICYQ